MLSNVRLGSRVSLVELALLSSAIFLTVFFIWATVHVSSGHPILPCGLPEYKSKLYASPLIIDFGLFSLRCMMLPCFALLTIYIVYGQSATYISISCPGSSSSSSCARDTHYALETSPPDGFLDAVLRMLISDVYVSYAALPI